MIGKLIDAVWNFFTQKLGTNLTVAIAIGILCIYVAVSYPLTNYVVTPLTLQEKVDSVNTKIDKGNAKTNIDIIEDKLDRLGREKSELLDKIDAQPKQRYLQRLNDINKYMDTLEKSKKESMKVLEKK
jgi:hypothetical protein